MTQILYFCKECGHRLSAEDSQRALQCGEDVQTSCCSACRKVAGAPAPQHMLDSPAPLNETAASASRRNSSDARREARSSKVEQKSPLIPFLGGAAAVGAVLLVIVFSVKSKPAAPEDRVAHGAPEGPVETKRAETFRAAAVTPAPIVREELREDPRRATTVVAKTQGDDLESGAALIDSLLRQRSFPRAMERIAAFEQSGGLTGPWVEKTKAWRSQAQAGSEALLGELVRTAEQCAEAGDARGVQAALGARPLMDLLAEHAQTATAKASELSARGDERAKALKAQRDEQAAQLRANFESTLPTDAELGAAPGGKILFGPGTKNALFESGQESVRNAAGRAAYLDGTQKVALSQASGLGMIQAGNDVCIEYTAVQDVQVYIKVSGEKDVGGTVTLPAGKLQRKTIAIDNKRASPDGLMLSYKGHWAGRSFKKVHLEFKNCSPGTIAVFRVSVK